MRSALLALPLIEGESATVNSFATGMNNRLRFEAGARAATESRSRCPITGFARLDDVTIWQALPACPAPL